MHFLYLTFWFIFIFLDRQDDLEDEDDDVFVTADPIRGQHVTVKSAIISTTNPYCTSARVSKRRFHNSRIITTASAASNRGWDGGSGSGGGTVQVEASAPSPSSDSSDSSLVLSSSASSTSSHSPNANNGSASASILSHDQVNFNISFMLFLCFSFFFCVFYSRFLNKIHTLLIKCTAMGKLP